MAVFAAESLINGIEETEDGGLKLRVSDYIQRARRDDPDFWYLVANDKTKLAWRVTADRQMAVDSATDVVLDGRALIAGSSGEGAFYILRTGNRVVAASSGPTTNTSDQIGFLLQVLAENVLAAIVIAMLGVSLVLMFAPRYIKRSLRALSERAAGLDPARSSDRLALADAPTETIPLVTAFNELLARNEAFSARQRRFLSDAGHELRTPVTRALLHLDALPPGAGRAQVALDLKWMGDIVTALLALARIEEQPLTMAVHDVRKIVAQCVADHAPRAAEAGREMSLDVPERPVFVHCNPVLLGIIINNLIDNALTHGRPSSPVIITIVTDSATSVAVSVANVRLPNGLRSIEQDDGLTRRLGLGLHLSQQAAAQFGATIEMIDTDPNLITARLLLPSLAWSDDSTPER